MTISLIERYYVRFNAGDRAGLLELLTDDVAHDINQGGREVGKAAFATFLERMDRCYRERISSLRIAGQGEFAAAEYVVDGTYLVADDGLPPARGQTYRLPGGAFSTLRDGRIARVTNYYTQHDWLAQVR